jgi:hypothetical protein
MAHAMDRQKHVLHHVLDAVGGALLAMHNGAHEGHNLAQEALVDSTVARLRQ